MAISTGCLELAESSVDSKKRYTHYSNFYGADGATAAVWIVVETLWKLKWKRKAKIRSYFFLSLCFPRDSVLPYKTRSFLQSSFLCSSIFDRHETFSSSLFARHGICYSLLYQHNSVTHFPEVKFPGRCRDVAETHLCRNPPASMLDGVWEGIYSSIVSRFYSDDADNIRFSWPNGITSNVSMNPLAMPFTTAPRGSQRDSKTMNRPG